MVLTKDGGWEKWGDVGQSVQSLSSKISKFCRTNVQHGGYSLK